MPEEALWAFEYFESMQRRFMHSLNGAREEARIGNYTEINRHNVRAYFPSVDASARGKLETTACHDV
jgi:hypothetical protein